MLGERLYHAIINDRTEHPERIDATYERVNEVAGLVLGNRSRDITDAISDKVKDPRAPLSEAQARAVVRAAKEHCSLQDIMVMAQLLEDCELSTAEAISLHEQYKIPVSRLETDIVPVRGEGAWIMDSRGRGFLDMDSNYSATNLGMNNPEIARGLYNQACQLISMKEDRVHIPRTRFLKSVQSMFPEGLNQFYWQNSGGEAVDKALKLAKAYTGHPGVIAMKGGFHGRTHGAVAVTHEKKYREPFFLDDESWVHFVEFNDADAVEKLLAEGKAKTVLLELVQGEEAGIRPAEKKYATQLRKVCDKHGAVMIVDEIQSGFGRTAEKKNQWFACMVYGVIPDIITIGKSFGGGYPVTAVVTNKQVSGAMKPGYDGSTFGGNPMAMVAAMIATRQMREKNVTENVIERSKQIIGGLEKLQKEHDIIAEVRGLGLMIAFRLPSADKVAAFQEKIAEEGVKTSLSTREWVRFLPPLILSEDDTDFLLEATGRALGKIA